MDSSAFVDAIKTYVADAAVEDTIANLKHPPGRRVPPDERDRSNWYNSLAEAEAAHVNAALAEAVHQAIFGFFAVLDGARVVEAGDSGGRFELIYEGDQRTVLNDPHSIGLHELFNAEE